MPLATCNISVLLLDQHGHFSQNVAVCLGKVRGLRLHVLSDVPWPAVRSSRFVRSFHLFSARRDAAEQLIQACRAAGADVVLPVGEFGLQLLTRCRSVLPPGVSLPPLATPEQLATVTDKFALANQLAALKLPAAATILFTNMAAAQAEIDRLTFPVLLKPVTGGAGLGIRRLETPDALLSALPTIPPATHIIQSFVPGRDVDCSVLCHDGNILAHTIQTSHQPRRDPYAVDTALRFLPHPVVLATVEKFLGALRWNGIAHLDTREDARDGRIHIVDVAARYWETLTASLAASVNFPLLACLAARNISFTPPAFQPITFFAAKTPLRELVTQWSPGHKTGLTLSLTDPAPRLLNLARRMLPRKG